MYHLSLSWVSRCVCVLLNAMTVRDVVCRKLGCRCSLLVNRCRCSLLVKQMPLPIKHVVPVPVVENLPCPLTPRPVDSPIHPPHLLSSPRLVAAALRYAPPTARLDLRHDILQPDIPLLHVPIILDLESSGVNADTRLRVLYAIHSTLIWREGFDLCS